MRRQLWMALVALGLVATGSLAAEGLPSYAPLPHKISSFGACVSDGYLYIYGGHTGRTHTYSTETTTDKFLRVALAGKWEELPSGPAAQGTALVAYQNKIYRIGGMQPRNKPGEKADTHSLASCASYDPTARKWTALPDLPEPRSSHDAVVVGEKLYVFGGWTMRGAGKEPVWLKQGLVLDLSKSPLQWEAVAQPFQRRALGIAALDGKVYVVGGLQAKGAPSNQVDIYDLAMGKWSEGAAIPGMGTGFSAAPAVQNGRLYLSTNDGKLHTLNRAINDWVTVGQQATARHVNRMVAGARGTLLIVGGSASAGDSKVIEVIPTASKKVSSR
ncbi:MAG: kelch repeat-containing protein [Gemmataceae bacterium]